MRQNHVKTTLRDGGVALGTFLLEFGTTGIARLAAEAGAEFAIFDMEHTGWGMETVRGLMASARAADLVPIVRVPATEYHFIARVLDVGAMGVMVPMVESAAQAEKLVSSAKYPPLGRRGVAFGVAHDDYRGGDMARKIDEANREGLVIGQVETAAGLKNVEAIAAVPGLDVIFLGQADLTTSLGIPGQYQNRLYLDALDRIAAACRAHDKALGCLALGLEDGRAFLAKGARLVAYGGDLWLYQQALRHGINTLRNAPRGD